MKHSTYSSLPLQIMDSGRILLFLLKHLEFRPQGIERVRNADANSSRITTRYHTIQERINQIASYCTLSRRITSSDSIQTRCSRSRHCWLGKKKQTLICFPNQRGEASRMGGQNLFDAKIELTPSRTYSLLEYLNFPSRVQVLHRLLPVNLVC